MLNDPFQDMKRFLIPAILALLGVAVVGTAAWVFFGRGWLAAREEAALAAALRADPRTAEEYARVETRTAEAREHPENIELYVSIGNGWKAIGDQTGEKRHYERAIGWYEQGIAASNRTNTVLFNNLATALRAAGRSEEAERMLREAIAINPGDPLLYLSLVDVLRYGLQRDSKDIIDVYRQGLDALVDNAPLVQSLAVYLEEVGRLEDALTYYRVLAAKYPGFEEKIDSLERRLQEKEQE